MPLPDSPLPRAGIAKSVLCSRRWGGETSRQSCGLSCRVRSYGLFASFGSVPGQGAAVYSC